MRLGKPIEDCSIEHFAFQKVDAKYDRKVLEVLLYEGMGSRAWTVQPDFKELGKLHPGGEKCIVGCLSRLRQLGLVLAVTSAPNPIFLIPALRLFVKEPMDQVLRKVNPSTKYEESGCALESASCGVDVAAFE